MTHRQLHLNIRVIVREKEEPAWRAAEVFGAIVANVVTPCGVRHEAAE